MACVSADTHSEWEFVRSLVSRGERDECRGPVLPLALSRAQICALDDILDSDDALDLLWSGYHSYRIGKVIYQLCAAHWMDLASLTYRRAVQHDRTDWAHEGVRLLMTLCIAAQWDAKEIVNMFAWQRARLT